MPATVTELFNQDLKTLVVGQPDRLTSLVVEHYQSLGLSTTTISLEDRSCLQTLTMLLSQNDYYKLVFLLNISSDFEWDSKANQQLIQQAQQTATQKIFIIGVSSKIKSTNQLCHSWLRQLDNEDKLLNGLYQHKGSQKTILAQDLVIEGSSPRYSPRFMVDALMNGFLLDPQIVIHPQLESDFFETIKKELIRSDSKNVVVSGRPTATEELCFLLQSEYQRVFHDNLSILEIETKPTARTNILNDLVGVIAPSNSDKVVKSLLSLAANNQLAVDPHLLSPMLHNGPMLFTTSTKPHKLAGSDFEFEPPVANMRRRDDSQKNALSKINECKKNKLNGVFADAILSGTNNPAVERGFGNRKESETQAIKEPDTVVATKMPAIEKVKTTNGTKSIINSIAARTPTFEETTPLPTKEGLEEKLKQIFSLHQTQQKTNRRTKKAGIIKQIRKKSRNKQIVFFGGLLLCLLGVVLGLSAVLLVVSYQQAQRVVTANLEQVIEKKYTEIEPTAGLRWQAKLFDSVFDTQLIANSKSLGDINQQLYDLAKTLHEVDKNSLIVLRRLFAREAIAFDQDQSLVQALLDQQTKYAEANNTISLFVSELESRNLKPFPPSLQSRLKQVQQELKITKARLTSLEQLDSVFPKILGVDEKTNVFIVLQDNTELRPTGGFLQAVLLLVIEDGRIVDHQAYSVDYLDQKVLGQLSSSPEIERLLGESRLYLRDANWDPDFSVSAQKISWFVKESLNLQTDVIVGVNYELIKNLLSIFPNIELAGNSNKLAPNNLFLRLERAATEESLAKTNESFHTQILESLIYEVRQASDDQLLLLTEALYNSFRNQQSTLYISDPQLNGVISQLGWSGSTKQPRCPSSFGDDCIVDSISQIDANIGINKVNPYVYTKINQNIEIGEDKIMHRRLIKIHNKAPSNIWPQGSYKAYIRFYLSSETQVEDIKQNNEIVQEDMIINYWSNEKNVVGVVVEVKPGEEKTLELNYWLPVALSPGQSYFYFEQPQPGVMNRLSAISLSHHQNLVSDLISPLVDVNQNQVVVTSDLGGTFLAIRFAEN